MSLRGRTGPSSGRGSTLVELMIAGSLLAVVLGSVALVASSSSKTFQRALLQTSLEDEARRGLDRMVEEIQRSGTGSTTGVPSAPLWSDSMNFDRVAAVSATDGSITWSPSRLLFEYATGETNNGQDDNRNRLADEGRVVLITSRGLANERRVVLANWVSELAQGEVANGADDNGNGLVDERGVSFSRSGNTLTIRLTLERRDFQQRLCRCSVWTTVQLRN